MLNHRSIPIALIVAILMTSPVTAGTARQLADCPNTPNCVSSLSHAGRHAVAPLSFEDSAQAAWERLRSLVRSMKRTAIAEEGVDYLRAEVRSWLFGFIDDVEFLLDADNKFIHVRSASRSGYSDFGVNRRRIERIRRNFSGPQGER